MKQYNDKYKDSCVEWIGEIPEQRDVKKVGFTTYVEGRIEGQDLTNDERDHFLTILKIHPYTEAGKQESPQESPQVSE
ncbi:hypothetical protein BEH94_09440 [Candidatus Altiarchaeales archaeon WOR_SM1_SCG]|nr:hypothetical protein BEH94_09440 [Candidatus Altiarchaeales archaeon WOR_SM1_SCG]